MNKKLVIEEALQALLDAEIEVEECEDRIASLEESSGQDIKNKKG